VIRGELANHYQILMMRDNIPEDGEVSHVHVENLVGSSGLGGSGLDEASGSERGQHGKDYILYIY
jgi:hypothetical protein